MPTTIYRLFLTLFFACLAGAPAFVLAAGNNMPAAATGEPAVAGKMNALTISVRQEDSNKILQVPLFSEEYAKLPVATVDGEPITLKKFSLELAAMHGGMAGGKSPESQSLTKMLERLITIKLVKQEALNIGFDRTPAVQKQIEKFALTTMIKQLLAKQMASVQVSEADTEELYQEMAIEAKLLTYLFTDSADAEAVLAATKAGGDFKDLAEKMVSAGKAERADAPEYVRLSELLPAIAQAVYPLEAGSVGQIFKDENGYLLFRLEDKRVYEDAEVRLAAASQLIRQKSNKLQMEYLESLIDKYAAFDEEGEAALDFTAIAKENPLITGTEVFSRLGNDQRPLATVSDGKETIVVTVAEIADKVKGSLYHGSDKPIDAVALNGAKDTAIWNTLVAYTGRMEAEAQGIDKTEVFIEQVEEYETEVLFDTFVAKAVVPGIKVPEDDAKAYYFNNLEEYASPLMIKMKSLPYTDEKSARDAFEKLQAGNDFKWVSANSTGLASADNKDILNIDAGLLSENALPADLQSKIQGTKPGDLVYYPGPDNIYYLLTVETVFPPEAKPYEEVRQEIGKIIYAQKINEALDEWVVKLKEVYETKVFLVEASQ